MSTTDPSNPYYVPQQAGGAPYAPVAQGQPITSRMLELLRGTKPWVQLLAILGFIGSGFMVLGGIGMIVAGSFMPQGTGANNPAPWIGPVGGATYIVMALVYLVPAIQLLQYGSAIERLMAAGTSEALEQALDRQRAFWKFAGVCTLVFIGLGILGGGLACVGGMMAAGAR